MQSILPGQVQERGPEKGPSPAGGHDDEELLMDGILNEADVGYHQGESPSEDTAVPNAVEGISDKVKDFKADMAALFDAQVREMQKCCDELCRKHFEEPSARIAKNAQGGESQPKVPHHAVVAEVKPSPRESIRKTGARNSRISQEAAPVTQKATNHDSIEMNLLLDAFLTSEEHLAEIEKQKSLTVGYRLRHLDRHNLAFFLDTISLGIVVVNALFLGVSIDLPPYGWLIAIEAIFTVTFLSELCLKLAIDGCKKHYCTGPGLIGNWFDSAIVFFDLLSLVLFVMSVDIGLNASLLRLLRLGKLARLGRVFRLPAAQTLVGMVEGMIGGLPTLAWTLLLMFLIMYTIALFFRVLLGDKVSENIYENFNTVPRSMFTTFRCSFGDCSSAKGVPIFEYVYQEYGRYYGLIYCIFTFTITIGLFNVISAIFVESTLAASASFADSKKHARLKDEILWATKITILVRRLCYMKNGSAPEQMSSAITMIEDMACEKSVIDTWAKDPEVMKALEDLDIDPQDFDDLSDILDPDQSGIIEVPELQEGLRRLRGFTRRSDVLRIDMMCREIVRSLSDLEAVVRAGLPS